MIIAWIAPAIPLAVQFLPVRIARAAKQPLFLAKPLAFPSVLALSPVEPAPCHAVSAPFPA